MRYWEFGIVQNNGEVFSRWILAQYQWYSGRSFRDILEVVPYSVMRGFYTTLHEVDVRKVYECKAKDIGKAQIEPMR